MGSSTVHTIFMARPDEEEMELFWKLYYAAQRVEDRWHHNTVGPIADELSHCPNLTRQEKMFLLRAWQVLVDGIGGFGRFMGAFDTYVHNMQDPDVGHVAYKPSLIEMFGNAELLPVVTEAYADALADRDSWQAKALATGKREESLKASTDVLAQRVKDLEAAAIVPGVLRCAKCNYELMKTNLYFNSGTVGPGDSETEPCPNGCGPLWPVSWHDWAITGFAEAAKAVEELPKPIRLPAPLLEVVGGDQVHGRVMANDMRSACIKAILAAGGKVEGV